MNTTGHCLCGAVTFRGKGAPEGIHTCHCRDCARWNGGPLMSVEFTESYDIEGPVHWFDSSQWAQRGSCQRCGSALFWRMRDGSHLSVSAGAFDDPTLFDSIDSHIFIDAKPAYYEFADNAPRLTAAEVIARFTGEAE
ncbi:MAG: GFA family protein [Pseudomonadota bacterium]